MTTSPPQPNATADASTPGSRSVLVTGGAGFIGSHLIERLLERGDRVTVIDNLSTGAIANLSAHLEGAAGRLRVITANLSDALAADPAADSFSGASAGASGGAFDSIYHLAAAVGVELVIEDPVGSIETNIAQTIAVLRYAQRARPGGVPTLIASSSEVYGKPSQPVFGEEDDVVYGPTTKARWSYAYSKALDEHIALAMHRAGQASPVCVRFFNTVGPRQLGRYGMVLPRFVRAALANEPLRVFGDGTQTRCFCDVRDVVDALPKLLDNPAHHGRVFNLGHDGPISILDLARTVISTLGSSSSIELVPYTDAYSEGFEDLMHRRPDLTRVREAIAFTPKIPLETTIRDLADSLGSPEAVAISTATTDALTARPEGAR